MNSEEIKVSWKPMLIVSSAIIVMIVVYAVLTKSFVGDQWQGLGAFGDSFGGLNTLFTGLAFAGLIFSVFLQRKDLQHQSTQLKLQNEELKNNTEQLALQKEELKLQRTELKNSVEQLAAQKRQMEIQCFETTFFNLLEMNRKIFTSISIRRLRPMNLEMARNMTADGQVGKSLEGYYDVVSADEYIKNFNGAVLYKNDMGDLCFGTGEEDDLYAEFCSSYSEEWKKDGEFFAGYFRNVFHSMTFIANKKTVIDVDWYSKLFFSHFSDDERLFMLLNMLSMYGLKARSLYIHLGLFNQVVSDHTWGKSMQMVIHSAKITL